MNLDKIKKQIELAKEISEEYEKQTLKEPYKSISYGIVLKEAITGIERGVGEIRGKEKEVIKKSINEFIKEAGAKCHTDITLVIAYYLERFEGVLTVNVNDIERCYSKAKRQKSANTNAICDRLVKNGYFMDAGEKDGKKAWKVTISGDEYIGDKLKKASS